MKRWIFIKQEISKTEYLKPSRIKSYDTKIEAQSAYLNSILSAIKGSNNLVKILNQTENEIEYTTIVEDTRFDAKTCYLLREED